MAIARFVAAVLALAWAFAASAQGWPAKPVNLVVPYQPGTGADVLGRFLAAQLQERTGQPFVVFNRPGASSMVGTQSVARAAPDGYTLLLQTVLAAMNVHLFRNLGYDQVKDFTPVTSLATAAFVLLVNPEVVPVASVAELTQYIRKRPGKTVYGGGTSAQVAGILYFGLAGLRSERSAFIPYKGGPEAVNDLRGGQIHFTFVDATFGIQQARGGRLRALAVTAPKRTSAAPEIPSMAEAGLQGYDLVGWYGMFLPANAPGDIARKLAELCNASLTAEKGREFLKTLAIDPHPGSPESFARFLGDEIAKWGRLMKEAGIEPQ